MKIQNFILNRESPESTKETLTKRGLAKEGQKGTEVTSGSPGHAEGHCLSKPEHEVSSFGLPKKSDQNENGAPTIFSGLKTKEDEKEHYHFLNEMRVRLKVDESKIIDLEARISCK